MCVICFKPQGVAMPEEKVLKLMHTSNSDGRGFMVAHNGTLLGAKFATFEQMLTACALIKPESPVVFHFRLATHGSKEMDGAHPFPFPLTAETAYVHQFEAPMAAMHNGIISGFGERQASAAWQTGSKWDFESQQYVDEKTGEPLKGKRVLSDTQEYLIWLSGDRDVCNRVQHLDKAVLKMIAKWTTGKWAFMRDSGKVRLLGSWEEVDGLWVSNTYWQWRYEKDLYFTGKNRERSAYIWKEKTTRAGGVIKEKELIDFQDALGYAREGFTVKYDEEWESPKTGKKRDKDRKKGTDIRAITRGAEEREDTGCIWSSRHSVRERFSTEAFDKLAGETSGRDAEKIGTEERVRLLGSGIEVMHGYFNG